MNDIEFDKEFKKTVTMLRKLSPEQVTKVLSNVLEHAFLKELAVDESFVAQVVKQLIKHRK
jgi:hypothetical protein